MICCALTTTSLQGLDTHLVSVTHSVKTWDGTSLPLPQVIVYPWERHPHEIMGRINC